MQPPKLYYLIAFIFPLCVEYGRNGKEQSLTAVTYTIEKIAKEDSTSHQWTEDVSLISLISNPEKYHNHRVRVIGYLNLEFEGNGLYLHKEDYDRSIEKNGLWVSLSRDSLRLPEIKKCNQNYVLIEGIFDKGNKGHMSMWSGALNNISRLEVWGKFSGVLKERKPGIKFPATNKNN